MSRTSPSRGEDETLDTFYRGRIRVLQKKKGYRFSVDAPLLADFIRTRARDELLELGTGVGIISLLLSVKPFRHITALEVQPGLADLAGRNVILNGLQDRISIVRADLRSYEPGRRFDVVFSNPPYFRRAAGSLAATPEKSAAKHELHGDIFDIMRKTQAWLEESGRAFFVYPEARRTDLEEAAGRAGMAVRTLRFVQARAGAAANLVLAAFGIGPGPLETLSPLVLYESRGRYTAEAEAIFAGRSAG